MEKLQVNYRLHIIKYGIAFLAYYSGFIHFLKIISCLIARKNLVILLYHRVIDPSERNGSMPEMTVSPEMFDAQMAWLVKHYHPISLDDLIQKHYKPYSMWRKPMVLVTFDDGWKDNYDNAYPIIKKYMIPAVIFLATEFVGTKKLFWPERFAQVMRLILSGEAGDIAVRKAKNELETALRKRQKRCLKTFANGGTKLSLDGRIKNLIAGLKSVSIDKIDLLINKLMNLFPPDRSNEGTERMILDWNEIKAMVENGLHFGAHSRTHAILCRIGMQELWSEVAGSKHDIEACTGSEVKAFAYPNGNYNEDVIEAVQKAGYKLAFTTDFGINFVDSLEFQLRRIRVDDRFSAGFCGRFSPCLFEFEIWRYLFSKNPY